MSAEESPLARAIIAAATRRAGKLLDDRLPTWRYGLVTAVDRGLRLATVDLPGPGAASPGFKYPSQMEIAPGDLVRVVELPTGDRYVDADMDVSGPFGIDSPGGKNMVLNGSFEFGTIGWSLSGPPPSITSVVPFDGRWTLAFGAGGYKYAGSQGMQFRAGRRYSASFWMTSAGTGATSTQGAGIVLEGLAFDAVGDLLTIETGAENINATPNRLVTAIPASWQRYWVSWVAESDQFAACLVTNSYGGTSTGEIRIDGVQVQEGWPTPYNDTLLPAVPPIWSAVSLVNGWVHFAAPYSVPGFMVDGAGMVHLRGLLKSGVIPATMFTLPVGARPSSVLIFAVASNDAFGEVRVDTSGLVQAFVGNNGWLSIDGIVFPAEA